jgi:hypothetical protein
MLSIRDLGRWVRPARTSKIRVVISHVADIRWYSSSEVVLTAFLGLAKLLVIWAIAHCALKIRRFRCL